MASPYDALSPLHTSFHRVRSLLPLQQAVQLHALDASLAANSVQVRHSQAACEVPVLKLNASAPSEEYKPTEEDLRTLRRYYEDEGHNQRLAEMTGVSF